MAEASPQTISKGDEVLLAVFGDPSPRFSGNQLPTHSDIASFWIWLDKNHVGYRKGAKNSVDNGAISKRIMESLMVQWRSVAPNTSLVKKETAKERIRDFINKKVKPLRRATDRLKEKPQNKDWIANKKDEFSSIFDIASDPEENNENENEMEVMLSKLI